MSDFDRPQNKFLEDMYDDFIGLISQEPSAWDIAKEKARQLDYNRKNANTFNTSNLSCSNYHTEKITYKITFLHYIIDIFYSVCNN